MIAELRKLGEKLLTVLAVVGAVRDVLNHIRPQGFNRDEIFQTIAAGSWLRGHGLSLLYASSQDLSRPVVQPIVGWPPGLSLAIALLLRLRNDPFWAFLFLKTAATIIFFASWWFIFRNLRQTTGILAPAVLFSWWGFIASPLRALTCSDIVSLALFCAGMAVNLTLFRRGGGWLAASLLAGVLVGSAAAVRYAYWPLVVVFPVCLATLAFQFRRPLLGAACAQLAVATAFVGLAAVYQYQAAGHATYLSQRYPSQGFYPHELKRIAPFPAVALGLDEDLRIYHRLGGSRNFTKYWMPVFWPPSLLILLICALQGRPRGTTAVPLQGQDFSNLKWRFVIRAACLASASTIAMLAYLTLRYPPEGENPFSFRVGSGWVFIEEPRYYAPTAILIYICLTLALKRFGDRIGDRRKAWLPLAVVLFALAIGPGLTRAWDSWNDLRYLAGSYRMPRQVELWVKLLPVLTGQFEDLSKSGLPLVYVDADSTRLLIAGVAGARILNVASRETLTLDGVNGVAIVAGVAADSRGPSQASLREQLLHLGGVSLGITADVELIRWVGHKVN